MRGDGVTQVISQRLRDAVDAPDKPDDADSLAPAAAEVGTPA
jgi:hypothetical protein